MANPKENIREDGLPAHPAAGIQDHLREIVGSKDL